MIAHETITIRTIFDKEPYLIVTIKYLKWRVISCCVKEWLVHFVDAVIFGEVISQDVSLVNPFFSCFSPSWEIPSWGREEENMKKKWINKMQHDFNILYIEALHYAVRSQVSFFYSALRRKTTKHVIILDTLQSRISNFTQECVLIFLSLDCSLVLWYILNEKFLEILLCFSYKTMGSGNQHGRRECNDLQN